ncbi:EscU/YscU/HrcU family type III secretion system export apparatus switch protein [Marinobacterium jannaschii]|uniref:EscU/YscU/HrcU family type III secretion system export apparatus switch protein n=1 Tax=Marinobacterium jannaschii TaxID=64970 RepID=UPI00048801D9|nr:EscU/YscU/HrcU family type III secretion system export apparatus switch protein [Marinobacterium jannaschii]
MKYENKKAVALSYKHQQQRAPLVVAKGQGEIAEQIIRLAEENEIFLHHSPELVEVLVRLELGEEIPESLYLAIAEVIAFAYGLKSQTTPQ